MRKWVFWDDGDHSPAFNMAADEMLMQWHREGRIAPVLRFYGWNPGGFSVGYFQKTNKFNLEEIEKRGFELVRRPTGGQAVLHHQELTYSIIVSEDYPGVPSTIKEAYKVLSQGLLIGFENLGIKAEFALPADSKPKGTANCFEEASWYEINVDRKKAAGSAQTRQKGVILQHGSIPIWLKQEDLLELFLYPSDRVKERAYKSFRNKAASLQEFISVQTTMEDIRGAFYDGFQKGLGVTFERLELDEVQLKTIEELAKEKYQNHEFLYAR
ncbi:biotin/lipoate A/B protein ligase family protein [Virgibacillus sp. 7505]|uniref:lipoate--protein ligase family protein n=1 Tax=Virgibacillus sp. 7505 TaxID=2022548 RepID=UPI0015960CCA|nr:biotin/lipoate A/B protein ligase family protein [Virgibacillus sp. 7505]